MKTFNLNLTEQQLNVISDALMHAPYGLVAPVVAAINEQLTKQPTSRAESTAHVEGAWASEGFGGTE